MSNKDKARAGVRPEDVLCGPGHFRNQLGNIKCLELVSDHFEEYCSATSTRQQEDIVRNVFDQIEGRFVSSKNGAELTQEMAMDKIRRMFELAKIRGPYQKTKALDKTDNNGEDDETDDEEEEDDNPFRPEDVVCGPGNYKNKGNVLCVKLVAQHYSRFTHENTPREVKTAILEDIYTTVTRKGGRFMDAYSQSPLAKPEAFQRLRKKMIYRTFQDQKAHTTPKKKRGRPKKEQVVRHLDEEETETDDDDDDDHVNIAALKKSKIDPPAKHHHHHHDNNSKESPAKKERKSFQDGDVLMGGRGNHHNAGNRYCVQMIRERMDTYHNDNLSTKEKSDMIETIYNAIRARGGCFRDIETMNEIDRENALHKLATKMKRTYLRLGNRVGNSDAMRASSSPAKKAPPPRGAKASPPPEVKTTPPRAAKASPPGHLAVGGSSEDDDDDEFFRPNDVVCGFGLGRVGKNEGNVLCMDLVLGHLDDFCDPDINKEEKNDILETIYAALTNNGGRFMDYPKKVELSRDEALQRINRKLQWARLQRNNDRKAGEREKVIAELAPTRTIQDVIAQVKVGSQVAVFWPEDDQYYPAIVMKKLDPSVQKKNIYIEYDDGDDEWIDLSEHVFRLLMVDAESSGDGIGNVGATKEDADAEDDSNAMMQEDATTADVDVMDGVETRKPAAKPLMRDPPEKSNSILSETTISKQSDKSENSNLHDSSPPSKADVSISKPAASAEQMADSDAHHDTRHEGDRASGLYKLVCPRRLLKGKMDEIHAQRLLQGFSFADAASAKEAQEELLLELHKERQDLKDWAKAKINAKMVEKAQHLLGSTIKTFDDVILAWKSDASHDNQRRMHAIIHGQFASTSINRLPVTWIVEMEKAYMLEKRLHYAPDGSLRKQGYVYDIISQQLNVQQNTIKRTGKSKHGVHLPSVLSAIGGNATPGKKRPASDSKLDNGKKAKVSNAAQEVANVVEKTKQHQEEKSEQAKKATGLSQTTNGEDQKKPNAQSVVGDVKEKPEAKNGIMTNEVKSPTKTSSKPVSAMPAPPTTAGVVQRGSDEDSGIQKVVVSRNRLLKNSMNEEHAAQFLQGLVFANADAKRDATKQLLQQLNDEKHAIKAWAKGEIEAAMIKKANELGMNNVATFEDLVLAWVGDASEENHRRIQLALYDPFPVCDESTTMDKPMQRVSQMAENFMQTNHLEYSKEEEEENVKGSPSSYGRHGYVYGIISGALDEMRQTVTSRGVKRHDRLVDPPKASVVESVESGIKPAMVRNDNPGGKGEDACPEPAKKRARMMENEQSHHDNSHTILESPADKIDKSDGSEVALGTAPVSKPAATSTIQEAPTHIACAPSSPSGKIETNVPDRDVLEAPPAPSIRSSIPPQPTQSPVSVNATVPPHAEKPGVAITQPVDWSTQTVEWSSPAEEATMALLLQGGQAQADQKQRQWTLQGTLLMVGIGVMVIAIPAFRFLFAAKNPEEVESG